MDISGENCCKMRRVPLFLGIRPQHHHSVVSGGNCHHLPGMALPAVCTITSFHQAINTRALRREEITTEGRHTLCLTAL